MGYKDSVWIVLSARQLFVAAGVNTFQAFLRIQMYILIYQFTDSSNKIILSLTNLSTTPVLVVEALVQLFAIAVLSCCLPYSV